MADWDVGCDLDTARALAAINKDRMMDETDKISLAYCVRQLRHAYMQLVNGYVKAENHKMFADGLLAPQIRYLESLSDKNPPSAK